MDIGQLVCTSREMNASDLHLVFGLPPMLRIDGSLTPLEGVEPLTDKDCKSLASQLLGSEVELRSGEQDFAVTVSGNRLRVNLFYAQGHLSAAVRLLHSKIPELTTLGLPPAVMDFPNYHRGIVLVTGETGSGKSTTLAALLNEINHSRACHIITLEDPVEYQYTPARCLINQREIGKDTDGFSQGLRAALREDPDILLVGEMRDMDTIETALTAAETGHLVFATLHTNSAADSIDRIVSVFPEGRQQQIRMQLSMTLIAVLTQQLIPKIGGGRALACELMMVNMAIRNLIRDGKTPQIASTIATSAKDGSISMDQWLVRLVQSRKVTPENACAVAFDTAQVKKNLML